MPCSHVTASCDSARPGEAGGAPLEAVLAGPREPRSLSVFHAPTAGLAGTVAPCPGPPAGWGLGRPEPSGWEVGQAQAPPTPEPRGAPFADVPWSMSEDSSGLGAENVCEGERQGLPEVTAPQGRFPHVCLGASDLFSCLNLALQWDLQPRKFLARTFVS